jgi:hypothetical protein
LGYGFVGPVATAGRTGEVHTTQKNPLLTEAVGTDGKRYIYLQGVASCIAGSWVAYDEAGVTVGLDTDVAASIVSPVAIATAAIVANTYGWFGIEGTFSAGVLTSFADGAKVFATSTVFMVDDTSVAGSQIVPAVGRGAESGGLAQVEIHRPFCGINVA